MPSKATLAIEWDVHKPKNWGKATHSRALPQPWYALDTERDSQSAEFVCGWISGNDTRRFRTFLDLPCGTYWVYNLAYDIEGMLRDLNLEHGWAAKEDGAKFELLGGTAVYFHGKRFNLKIGDKRWSFLEAAAFNNRKPLKSLGDKGGVNPTKMNLKMYLANEKYEREIQNEEGEWMPSGQYGYYKEDVDNYCIIDCRIVWEFITKLANGLAKAGVEIAATPGGTARRFMKRMPQLPEVIWTTHKAFLRSYCGGRFEITKRGVLHDVKQYDIVSAYPWALSKCPWLTNSAYSRATRRVNDNALYGSYQVRFKSHDYLGIAPQWRNGVRVYSKAEDHAWLTKPEVDYLQAIGAPFSITQGVEIYDENATDLWADVIRELFVMKQSGAFGTGPKVILNSEYGILIQLIRKSGEWVTIGTAKNPVDFIGLLELEEPPKAFDGGKFFAPVYAANLTALTRLKILRAALETGPDNYIGGHTDSVLTMGKLNTLGKDLGDWELQDQAPIAHICKTGFYAMGDKVKMRGITRRGKPKMLWEDNLSRRTRISLKRAKNWDEVSCIVPRPVANNWAVETKREWKGEITRGLIAMERHIDSEALQNVGE